MENPKLIKQSRIRRIAMGAGVEKELFASYVTTKAQKGGSGLGLAISKNLVEQSMGGSIELENKDEGVPVTPI